MNGFKTYGHQCISYTRFHGSFAFETQLETVRSAHPFSRVSPFKISFKLPVSRYELGVGGAGGVATATDGHGIFTGAAQRGDDGGGDGVAGGSDTGVGP